MNNIDEKIKIALKKEVENIYPDENMLYTIKNLSYYKEETSMKKFRFLKTALLCVAVCTAITTIVSANAIIRSISSHSNTYEEITHYPSESELAKYINFTPSYPEKLGKYDFKSCTPVHNSALDSDDNIIAEYTGMNFTYSTDKGILTLDTDFRSAEPSKNSVMSEHNGIEVFYNKYLYKAVPADYRPSAEEEKLESNGKLQIGYGSDKIETMPVQSAVWEKDGISYCLLDMGTEIDENEFIGFAEQIIDIE